MSKSLLPAGCYDVLPPYARQESLLSSNLLNVFDSYGYEQVAPSLLEYSDNLLSGRGAELSDQIFRVMDPAALKVMGIRTDITMQIARIASSRLMDAPRPLRLCYNGLIMRMKPDSLKSDRQLRQAGIELIGAKGVDADAEVILVAATSLMKTGIRHLTIDISLPGIVKSLLGDAAVPKNVREQLFDAVSHKDATALERMSVPNQEIIIGLMKSVGNADEVLAGLNRLKLPSIAKIQLDQLSEVIDLLNRRSGNAWPITLDLTENSAFKYHTGLCFSIFLPELSVEVGRGGRYEIQSSNGTESATGFTLYVETLRQALADPSAPKRIMVDSNISIPEIEGLREQGYVTLYSLDEYGNRDYQAKQLGCEAIYADGKLQKLSGK